MLERLQSSCAGGELPNPRRPIRRLLIANRGEIAVRIARTARSMGMFTVAIHSDPDEGALHARACDESIAIGGATAAESYLRIDAVLAAAERAGADAIHPGYGFLSENAIFAEAVLRAGLIWVGPRPETIAIMGDKVKAKRRMAEAGVPVLADLVVDDATDLLVAASTIPLPIMAKAAAGGGGKGMRLITDTEQLVDQVEACRREAAASFGDDCVFLEHYLAEPRHVEVQIVGDSHGNVIHLFERECSIQRRHQKVLEESPSPGIDARLREQLCRAAVAAGKALGYQGAGTVEFVVGKDGSPAFLEVNTRLQVEHPVTEAITGLDLVRLQLLVAQGERLPITQDDVVTRGHAIEARLYAEDPSSAYLPAAGMVHDLRPALESGVRWDSGVESGSAISHYYDPLLAKVIAFGQTRSEAARILERALRLSHLHGPATNRDLLCAVLSHPAFLAGATTTEFLSRHFPTDDTRTFTPDRRVVQQAAIISALASEAQRRSASSLPSGWRNNRAADESVSFAAPAPITVGYRREQDGTWICRVDDRIVRVLRHAIGPNSLSVTIDGHRLEACVSVSTNDDAAVWEVTTTRGHIRLAEIPRFPRHESADTVGATRAPMHGVITVVAVSAGTAVRKGDLLCIVEAMKMEHCVLSPFDGVVASVEVEERAQVEAHQTLVVIEEA